MSAERAAKQFKQNLIGYSDSENPFGDSELSQQFVWKKKEQRDGFAGLEEHEKLIYNQDELAKVRQSRLDRQFIRKVNDEEFSKVQKAKEEEYYAEWERKSTEMNKKQVWLRSKIRLENSNAKPIDWLAYFVATENIEEANECKQYMHTPQQIIHSIENDKEELKNLLKDIKALHETEFGKYPKFWPNLIKLVNFKLETKYYNSDPQLIEKAKAILSGKNIEELAQLRKTVQDRLKNSDRPTNVEYWEIIIHQCNFFISTKELDKIAQKVLHERKELLKSIIETNECNKIADENGKLSSAHNPASNQLTFKEFEKIDPVSAKAIKLRDHEEEFTEEIDSTGSILGKKIPKYFNTVIYINDKSIHALSKLEEEEVPLPKIISGYKFNIYYPDLKDLKSTPKFKVVKDRTEPEEYDVLVFTAPDVYMPLKFRIKKGTWKTEYTHGYKCDYKDHVMHLWFRFFHLRYRK